MTEKEWLEKLQKDGYTDVRICQIVPGEDPEHVHPLETINVILSGEMTIIDEHGSKTYKAGDTAETPAGVSHRAVNGPSVGKMIVGLKKK